jgi:DNA-binding IclR family transcriptional regulator
VSEAFVPVKSADRVLEVLEALASARERPTLAELAQRLGIPKSSLHALLQTMVAREWVAVDGPAGRYGLGLRSLQVGAAYLDADDTVGLLSGLLDDLAARFGETVHLGRLDHTEVVYLAKRESVHPLRMFSAVGRRLPAHATALGKALLAERDGADVAAMMRWPAPRLTADTICRRADVMAELEATRARGFAVDREENTEGIVCFAVTVPFVSPPVDAISVSVPTSRLTPAVERSIVTELGHVRRRLAGRAIPVAGHDG